MSQEKTTSFGFNSSNSSNAMNDDSKDLPIKLAIYDFDQTITCDHLYYELDGGQEDELKKMSDEKLLDMFGGKDRQQRLMQHFERIESTNCELVIMSHGWVNVITNALQRMGLYSFFNKNTSIIGKDSELLKIANGSKAQCISKMKSDKKLRSAQILFIDDDNANIQRATRYCTSILIKERKGMTNQHMKDIETQCGIDEHQIHVLMNITTPKTVQSEISKHYPSQKQPPLKPNKLDKYKIKEVPKRLAQMFDQLDAAETETPVIQIGGDQTPVSESGEYELAVPIIGLSMAQDKASNDMDIMHMDISQSDQPNINGGLSLKNLDSSDQSD